MAAANLQRTSWSPEEVRGQLAVEWYRPIEPYVQGKVQVVAAEDKLFISTAAGLYAFDSASGNQLWSYGTPMPLGNSPTYANGVLYVGGYDRRIHAVNASDGKLKSGWTFVEAAAGYETNPLVLNGRVYAGNRDGYFYCLDANNGSLIWKWRDDGDEYPDAPIRHSAAYKNGIFYFGSDNSHAYAIRDNGASAALVWKSEKLPGVGFSTYWPVVYTDKSSGVDYVLFSGTKKEVGWSWFDETYYTENYDIFSGIPTGALVGPTGTVAGDWVAGTRTIDASRIQQYLNQHPHKRHLFVLNAATGAEPPVLAPVTWVSTTHGGAKQPPVIGGDGVIYTHIGYKNGDPGLAPNAGASGGISGWKFGTQYISQVYDFVRGYADESVSFTAGGNLIYWTEGFNMGYGAIEISKPMGTNAIYEYAPCGGIWGCLGIPGYNVMYQTCGLYGSCNGVLGGGTSALFPYKGRLYMLEQNALIAFSRTGGARKLATAASVNPTTSGSSALPTSYVSQRLEAEVSKMLAAGHLRPGFHDSGLWGQSAAGILYPYVEGDHLGEYYHNPGDTVTTLLSTLPYLSASLQTQVKNYVKSNYGPGAPYDFTKIAHIGWKNGALREIFTDTPERAAYVSEPADDPNKVIATIPRTYSKWTGELAAWKFPQTSFYAAWKYAEVFPAEAATVFNAMKGKLEPTSSSPNYPTDAQFVKYPYILNAYLAGYRGYMELERLAGLTWNISQSSKWSEYSRLLDLRINQFSKDTYIPDGDFTYETTMNVARNFMFMVPELADELRNRAAAQAQAALTEYVRVEPYWFVSKSDETYAEGVYQPLYDYNALFRVKAYVLQDPYEELVKYLDIPAFYRGDLFFLQDLVAALDASGGAPSPTFADVPFAHPYHDEIEALYQAGYTAGCATDPLRYCPEQTMNRGESAVFVERGIHSASYDPPTPTVQVFADLALDSWAAKWVSGLWQDQYTAGCGTDPLIYCPWQGHTRAEGCVFYLRMMNGATYDPPAPATQSFSDVPLDAWYAKWVKAAYEAGLIPACQTSPEVRFCPNDPLTRAMAAYMMVKAKGLTLP
jgi:outer membrane protein assembly factor BamB